MRKNEKTIEVFQCKKTGAIFKESENEIIEMLKQEIIKTKDIDDIEFKAELEFFKRFQLKK